MASGSGRFAKSKGGSKGGSTAAKKRSYVRAAVDWLKGTKAAAEVSRTYSEVLRGNNSRAIRRRTTY